MKYLILITFILALIGAVQPIKPSKKAPEIIIIGNFKHDKRLQDAGDFESFKPTPEQERKYKLIKWESDKYK